MEIISLSLLIHVHASPKTGRDREMETKTLCKNSRVFQVYKKNIDYLLLELIPLSIHAAPTNGWVKKNKTNNKM